MIVFHIGLTKAASTTLQAFFSSCHDIHYPDRYILCEHLVPRSSLYYDQIKTKQYIQFHIKKAEYEGKHLVFSHERLSGNPHSGHYDCAEIALRIQMLVPDPMIIIVLREQLSMLSSCYKQYIRIGGVKKLEEYLLPVWDFRVPLFDWTFYQYVSFIQLYFDLFGESNVKVLLMEDLAKDSHNFFSELSKTIGVTLKESHNFSQIHNLGIPDKEIEKKRMENCMSSSIGASSIRDPGLFSLLDIRDRDCLINKIRKQKFNNQEDMLYKVTQMFEGKFAESNLILSRILNKDLQSLGYKLA